MKKTLFSLFVLLVTCSAFSQKAIKHTLYGIYAVSELATDANSQVNYLKNQI